jgi:hypothetical protein
MGTRSEPGLYIQERFNFMAMSAEEKKEARRIISARYYEKNKDKIIEKVKQYEEKNKDKKKERFKKYYEKNKDILMKQKVEYQAKRYKEGDMFTRSYLYYHTREAHFNKQQKSLETATNQDKEWAEDEIIFVFNSPLNNFEKAISLKRSYESVKSIKKDYKKKWPDLIKNKTLLL